MTNGKINLLVLVGPTAIGKTKLSLTLAKAWNAEIISGDSMQVYRGMDIGTAKISRAEMDGVPHHMIDIHEPDEPFSVQEFQQRAADLIEDIAARGKLPFLVGGTGLYVESLCYGFSFSEGGADEDFREQMREFAVQYGEEALHGKLREVDPAAADRLHPHDVRRVIRALEVYRLTGIPQSEQLAGQAKQSPYQLCLIGLTMERQTLYQRIEARIDQMLQIGLLREVEGLLRQGYGPELVSMQGLGYKELVPVIRGEQPLSEAVELLKRNTRHFAKRQLSWFRHMREIHWVDGGKSANFVGQLQAIHAIIAGKLTSKRET